MPVVAKELGAIDVRRAEHPGGDTIHRIAVGGVPGLLLSISPTGAKSWVLRTMIGGKRRELGLGPFPEVSLADARQAAREARGKIRTGIDPLAERRAARAALAAAAARSMTFADAVERWMSAKMSKRPEKSQKAIRSAIVRYAGPEIGAMDVQDIGTQDVARVLSPIWAEKVDTAAKLRTYLEGIFAWATVAGHRTGDNPAAWRGNLRELLPSHSTLTKGKESHYPAVALPHLADWWRDLSERDGVGAMALRFAALTAARSGEVRGATWDEINLEAAMWTIPASRMKAGASHRVPLTAEALTILKDAPRLDGSPYVFPAARGGQLSDMSVSAVMRRMQEDAEKAARKAGLDPDKAGWRDALSGRPAVPHGLRSSFRDWCAETGVDRDLAELCLAHAVGSDVERAYRRSDMIERRRAVMERWADRLSGREAAKVVPIRATL